MFLEKAKGQYEIMKTVIFKTNLQNTNDHKSHGFGAERMILAKSAAPMKTTDSSTVLSQIQYQALYCHKCLLLIFYLLNIFIIFIKSHQ